MTTLNPDLTKPTCRVCLQSNTNEAMSSIFDVDLDFYDLRIYEKIEQCAGIKVLRHDKMPTLICGDCYGFLKVSYRFRIICRNSNEYLKEFVAIGSASAQIEEFFEENPLLISGNVDETDIKRSQYKTKLRDKSTQLPQTNKCDQDIASTYTKAEDYIDDVINEDDNAMNEYDGVMNEDDGNVWFDVDYQYDEDNISRNVNVEISVGLCAKKEKENIQGETSIKPQKNFNVEEANDDTTPSKTLEISPDGAAIIREKKHNAKRVKKEKQPHICDVCGNIYQRRYALELHMRRHRDEKPYECEICGYAFHSNFELIRHMRKHTGSRPYNCNYCTRAFGDQSTLIKHERIHRNERPFKCDTCGKSFTYSNVLKHHKLTHTGEKPYTCELCGKCFTRPHHLRAHLETLQHLTDPRSKILLQNIRKNNIGEPIKGENFTLQI